MLLRPLRLISFRPVFIVPNHYSFAKEAPKKDGGKKEEAPPPVPEQPKVEDLLKKWLTPTHDPLSPSEQKYLSEGFEDLSASDKQILDSLADRLLELPTAVLLDVIKKGALGTTNMYYTAVDPLPEEEIPDMLKHLRKEL